MMSERTRPAVRVITCETVSATAADRWMAQYAHHDPNWKFADGSTRDEVRQKLAAAEKTYAGLKGILNSSWLMPTCDICGEYAFVVAETARGYGGEEKRVCLSCAQTVTDILSAFPRALDCA